MIYSRSQSVAPTVILVVALLLACGTAHGQDAPIAAPAATEAASPPLPATSAGPYQFLGEVNALALMLGETSGQLNATAYLARGGPIRVCISISVPVARFTIAGNPGEVYLDGMYVNNEFGGGVSVTLAPLGGLLHLDRWLYAYVPPARLLIERGAVGTCLLYDGANTTINGGPYLRMPLWKTTF